MINKITSILHIFKEIIVKKTKLMNIIWILFQYFLKSGKAYAEI